MDDNCGLCFQTGAHRVLHVHVLVATKSRDLAAQLISAAVSRSTGMVLLGNRVAPFPEVADLLAELPPFAACALVLVGPRPETKSVAARWLRRRPRLVVVQVDILTDIVQITASGLGMEPLLAALRELLERATPWAALLYGAGEPSMDAGRALLGKQPGGATGIAYAAWGASLSGDPAIVRSPVRSAGARACAGPN